MRAVKGSLATPSKKKYKESEGPRLTRTLRDQPSPETECALPSCSEMKKRIGFAAIDGTKEG